MDQVVHLAARAPGEVPCDGETLLVVDDSGSDRRLVREYALELGWPVEAVSEAGSLTDALRSIYDQPSSVILLDLSLPDASGLEAVSVLAGAAPNSSIVVLSAQADSVLYGALAQGADEFMSKDDLDVDMLGEALSRAVQRRRGRARADDGLASARAVLDSLDLPSVALDRTGRIIAVNAAWDAAAAARGFDPRPFGVGADYLAVCDRATGEASEGAAEVADGIRTVLEGDTALFTLDYRFPEPDGSVSWFSVRVTPYGGFGGGAIVSHHDITPLKRVEAAISLQRNQIGVAFDAEAPLFALVDRVGRPLFVSDGTLRLLGLTSEAAAPAAVLAGLDPDDRVALLDAFHRVGARAGATDQVTVHFTDATGRERRFELAVANALDDPSVNAIAMSGREITGTRFRHIGRHLEQRLLRRLPVALVVADERDVIVYWNDVATRLFGHAPEQVLGRRLCEVGLHPAEAWAAVRGDAGAGRWEGAHDARRADGSSVPVRVMLERITAGEVGLEGVALVALDDTERRRAEAHLAARALHDTLTGLPNRRLFVDHLNASLATAAEEGTLVAVLFIDLDDFKAINDGFGHLDGDDVLRIVGRRISERLRMGDIAARFGGDEFVVCCDGLDHEHDVAAVVDRIRRSLAEPVEIRGTALHVSASIGIAFSSSAAHAEGVIRNADAAMYMAKEKGKGRAELFDAAQHERVRTRHGLADDLAEALDRDEVVPFFQPQFDLLTGRLVGFEALARWHHPARGNVSPLEFISVAEEAGLIGQLGERVLEHACAGLRELRRLAPGAALQVSVNASAVQVCDPHFVSVVRDVVERYALPPASVCLEVTESTLVDAHLASVSLAGLKDLGLEIAIDDFGTGYSSLDRLQRFPVEFLKIDRTFVDRITEHHRQAVIVSAIVGLAKNLGLRTIAEGVETELQRDELRSMGCDIGQGYLWSPAVPLEAACALVRREASVVAGTRRRRT